MKNARVYFASLLMLGSVALSIFGCSPVSPPVAYHSLIGEVPAKTAARQHPGLAIVVGPVTVPDVLKQSQIATGGGPGRYQVSEQHRWAGEIDRDFARAVGEHLAALLGTEQIALYPQTQHLESPQQIAFDLLALEGELGREARLVVRWSLIDPKATTARLTRRSSLSGQPADSGYDAWIAAQRLNIQRLSEEIAAALTATR